MATAHLPALNLSTTHERCRSWGGEALPLLRSVAPGWHPVRHAPAALSSTIP